MCDSWLCEVVKVYFEYLMSEMMELCWVIGVVDFDIVGELLIGILDWFEYEVLMVLVEEFDE